MSVRERLRACRDVALMIVIEWIVMRVDGDMLDWIIEMGKLERSIRRGK